MERPRIYLDNSATTRPYEAVVRLMAESAYDFYGNPSSLHRMGFEAEQKLKEAANTIAASLHAMAQEILFTSGGTESNNLAICGALRRNPRLGKKILTTKVEHPAVLEVFRALEREGYQAVYLGVDRDGALDMDALEKELRESVALVSCMHVNNETGAVFPIEEIGRLIKQKQPQALFHVDAVQSYGKLPLDLRRIPADFVSASAHKLHGPRGVGFLYVRKSAKLSPIVYGGGQMRGLRSGTENLPGILGFSLAARMSLDGREEKEQHVRTLQQSLLAQFQSGLDQIVVHSPDSGSPYLLNVSFLGVRSEVLLHSLDSENICVSSGSACSAHKPDKSHVLAAMGASPKEIDSAIRFSFSEDTTQEEIDETAAKTIELVGALRKVMR